MTNEIPKAWQERAMELYPEDAEYSKQMFTSKFVTEAERAAYLRGLRDEKWIKVDGDPEFDDDYKPTHWQPLPKPPSK